MPCVQQHPHLFCGSPRAAERLCCTNAADQMLSTAIACPPCCPLHPQPQQQHHTQPRPALTWSCRSHSPPWSQMGQSRGWLMSRNSITPSRAFFTSGVSVLMFMPGAAGMAQEATGLGLFSTCGRTGRAVGGSSAAPPSSAAAGCSSPNWTGLGSSNNNDLAQVQRRTGAPALVLHFKPGRRQKAAAGGGAPPPSTSCSCPRWTAAGDSRTCRVRGTDLQCSAAAAGASNRVQAEGWGSPNPRPAGPPAPRSLYRRHGQPSREGGGAYLGISTPAASQACSTLLPFRTLVGLPSTVTSM